MLIIKRNGKTTVVKGWQAWLLGVAVLAAVWIVLFLLAIVWLGFAVSMALVAILIIPALAVAGLLQAMFGRRW